jgi:hypothetical protein
MFWDMIFQGGYLVLNAVIAFITLRAEREGVVPPAWIKPADRKGTASLERVARPFLAASAHNGQPRVFPGVRAGGSSADGRLTKCLSESAGAVLSV